MKTVSDLLNVKIQQPPPPHHHHLKMIGPPGALPTKAIGVDYSPNTIK